MHEVNLDLPSAPIREHRLGSIIGYEGTAADLAEKSRNGTLRERTRSFTQCSTCASECSFCQLSLIQDAAVVNHGPLGCAADFSAFNMVRRVGMYKRGMRPTNAHVISSNLQENDTIYGGVDKLIAAVRAAQERWQPRAIFVTASCVSGIIGEDIDGTVAQLEQELGIPIATAHCEGFKSQIWSSGFDAAFHAILRRIVKPPREKHPERVNVITFWGDNVFSQLFHPLGLTPNLVVPFATVEQLETLSESGATAQMCSTLGTYFARGLEEKFGVPEVKAPPPYGIAGTDAWLRAIAAVLGKEKETEVFIESEHKRIAPELDQLRQRFEGIRGFVAAGAVHGHSNAAAMRELGIEIVGGCFWHHDPHFDHDDARADSLSHLVRHYGNMPVGVCNKQAFELVNQLRKYQPDIFIVRHAGLSVWGAKLGVPTFLIEDEHYSLGYEGLLRFGRKIADTIANPSFVKHLAKHTRLPYTDWWLEQEPFSLLEPNA